MILYKYIDQNSLAHFFQEDFISIKFSPHSMFNDPFESYGYAIDDTSLVSLTMRNEINENLACLCLSKKPLNVLMWAHYGNKHQGFVVEIDTEKAGFEDNSKYLITAQNGSIEYLMARQKGSLKVDLTNVYDHDIITKLLLNKSIHWSYEEEVRVIKKTNSLIRKHDILIDKITNLEAITGIYIGMRNENFNEVVNGNEQLKNLIINQRVKLYRCDFKKSTWDLESEEYQYVSSPHIMERIDVFSSLGQVVRAIERNHIDN
ncbi:TPA: DUF2971 domain-containing protein [Klebsiella pneumoniae]|uniref:DUF2971 domain-containing protein n=1 Tax=Klebsiella pneumoniae TaxID=573 RepID=UPI001082320E|nr:DUF2971 domain-containing protein [Klebsiella pneumoniae]VGF56010.1 Protein of uncharacterised function (DUF2971) [Klebsiella pneumoniae]HBY8313990.1 DUF2971 domain-containing protein [Klebsiella pneumoniae]